MGLARLFYDVELPLADVLGDMERIGMPVDARPSRRVGEELQERIEELEQRIYEDVGHPFNIGSPKQLGEVLFEELGTPAAQEDQDRLLDRRQGAAAARHREPDSRAHHRVPRADQAQGHLHRGPAQADHRGRPHPQHPATRPGRRPAASPATRPTCRTFPIRTEMGARIRDAFTASPGRRLVVADYSQIELRILAHMTQEPALVQSFTIGRGHPHAAPRPRSSTCGWRASRRSSGEGPRWSTSASSTASRASVWRPG